MRTFHAVVHPVGGAKEIMLRHRGQVFVDELREAKRASARTSLPAILLSDLPKHVMECSSLHGARDHHCPDLRPGPVRQRVGHACALRRLRDPDASEPGSDHRSHEHAPLRHAVDRLVVSDLHEFTTPLTLPPADRLAPGDIKLEQVTFSYPGSKVPAVRNTPSTSLAAPPWPSWVPAGRARAPWSTCSWGCTHLSRDASPCRAQTSGTTCLRGSPGSE